MGTKMSNNKDWNGNKTSYVSCNGFANNREYDREKHDYYATEPRATELLLTLDDFSNVWECACGGGYMAKVLEAAGILSLATDKYASVYGYGKDFDFLTETKQWEGDIITNPPYKYAGDFIKQAMRNLSPGGKLALFLPDRYLSSKSRRKIFEEYPPYKVWISSSRLACAINGDFEHMDGSAVDYMWMIWHKGYKGETKLGWLN